MGEYPQESYAAVVCAIQYEWIFLQRVIKNMVDTFKGVDKLFREFLPRLFFGKSKSLSPIVGTLSKILVKKSGLGLLIPVTSANEKYLGFKCAST